MKAAKRLVAISIALVLLFPACFTFLLYVLFEELDGMFDRLFDRLRNWGGAR